MFKNWSIGVKLATGFSSITIILLIVGALSLLNVDALGTDVLDIDSDTRMADAAMESKYAVVQIRLRVMEAFDASSAEEVEAIRTEIKDINQVADTAAADIVKIAESDTTDSDHLEVIKLVEAAEELHDGVFGPAVEDALDLELQHLAAPEDAEIIAQTVLADIAVDESGAELQALMESMEEITDSMITESTAGAKATASEARLQSMILLAIGIALSIALSIIITRSITKPLERVIAGLSAGAEQVTSAANQVSQASQQMAQGASEQASSLEETSSSLEEMSSMTRQNAENSKQADGMAREARASATKGVDAMDRMSDAIGRIKESADSTAKIIKTIDEIAFQTNLLALNAAVEAARAGEAGKGFAVVAEEVRNLAQRSAEAAKTTSALIEGSQANSDDGVKVTGDVGDLLKQIAEQAEKVTSLVSEVAAASDEQAQGIDQINTAVSEMDRVTQTSASNSEESASASEELSAQARELQDMVVQLRMVAGGAKAASRLDDFGYVSAAVAGSRGAASADHRLSSSVHGMLGRKGNEGDGGDSGARHLANGARRAEEVVPLDDEELRDF